MRHFASKMFFNYWLLWQFERWNFHNLCWLEFSNPIHLSAGHSQHPSEQVAKFVWAKICLCAGLHSKTITLAVLFYWKKHNQMNAIVMIHVNFILFDAFLSCHSPSTQPGRGFLRSFFLPERMASTQRSAGLFFCRLSDSISACWRMKIKHQPARKWII